MKNLFKLFLGIIIVALLTMFFNSCASSSSDNDNKAKIVKREDIEKVQVKTKPNNEKTIEELLNDLETCTEYKEGSKYLIYLNDSVFFGWYECSTSYRGDVPFLYYREKDRKTRVQIFLHPGDVVKWKQL